MATLEIAGHHVQVDDAFKSLSPEDQQKTVNEIAQSLGIQDQGASQANADMSAMTQQAGAGQSANPDRTDNLIRANMEARKIDTATENASEVDASACEARTRGRGAVHRHDAAVGADRGAARGAPAAQSARCETSCASANPRTDCAAKDAGQRSADDDVASQLARQHGAWHPVSWPSDLEDGGFVFSPSQLWSFVKAVEEAERERCAKACESLQVNKSKDYFPGQAFDGACRSCANAIRGVEQ